MATKNKVEVGININDMGTADKAIRNAERLKAAYESASASASKLGGTAGSRAAAEMSNQQYGQARGTTGQTGASARDFANQAQGLGGLVRLYATYAANVFAVGAAFRALSGAMDTTNMIRGLDALGSRSGQSLGTLSKRISDLTDGAVSLREAMEVTAKGSAAGLSSQQMERLAKVAKSSSIALGVSMPDALSRLSRGISKLEPELLDELGIFTKIGPAVTKYAASLGKAESSLTDFERRQAFANAVLEEGEKKFAAINDELQANSYDKLAASLKNVAYEGLNLVNKVLGPIVEFLSQTPVALIGVLGLLGGKILKQAGATISQFKDQYLQAAKTIKEQNELRIADLNSFSEKASKILANQANLAADTSLEAFEKKETEYKKLIARTSQKFATTNLTKLFDPNLAIGDINEQQWNKAEERLKKLQSMKKLTDAQSRELAAGTALFEAKAAEESANKIREANKAKFDELLKQSNAYKNVQAAIHKAEIKQTQDEIAGNFVKARSLFGISNAWSIMQAEIALAGDKINFASKSMIYFKAATGLATEAVAFLGRVLNKAFLIIGLAVTAFEILSSIFSKNAKESAAFSSAVDTAEESVKNAERTVKSYIKSLGYLNQSSIETAKAIDNAFGEISNSTKKMLSTFEETIKTQGTFDRAVDYLWKAIGKSSYDKVGRTLANQINSALELAARAGMGEELKAKLADILILNESDLNNTEKVISRITKLAEIAPDKLQKVSAAMDEVKKQTAVTAGAFDQLKQATDAYIKLQQEFYQSTESKDPLFTLAGGLLKISEALTNTFNQGINGISAFYKLIGQSPEILGAFSEDTRSKIISNYSTIIQLTEDLGKKQERLRSVQKGLSEIGTSEGSKDLNDWTTKYLSLQREQSKLNKEISIVQKLMSQSQADAVNFINEIATKAEDLIKKAVKNAKELNVIKFDKQLAQLLTGVNKVELEYSANKRELDIKIKEIDINLQQIDSTIALTDAIKELNLTESIRLEKEKNPQGSQLLTNLTLQKTINDQVADILKQIAENPKQRENILAATSPQVQQVIQQRELLKQQRESAQLATKEALEGDKRVLQLKYQTDLVKAQVEDYNKKLAIEISTANITISNLENSKKLNEISEEEYINKKLIVEQTILDLNYTKEINSLIQSRQSLLEQAAKLSEKDSSRKRLEAEAAKLQADIDAKTAKRDSDSSKIATDAAKLRLELAFKINSAELKNRQELDNLEQSRKEFETTRYSEILKQQESILDFAKERGLISEQQYIQQKLANDLSIASEEHRNKLASIKLATEQKIAELQLQLASGTKTSEERKILKDQISTAQAVGNENKRQEEELYKLKVNNITQTAQIQYEKSFDALYNAITEALIKGGDEGGKIFRKAITDELKKPFNIIVRALIKPIVDIVSSLTAKASETLLGSFGLGDIGKLLGLSSSTPNVKAGAGAGASAGGMNLLSLIGAPFAALGAGVKAITSDIKGLTDTVSKSSATIDKALDKVDSQATVTADSLGELGINTDLIAKNTASPGFNLDYADAVTTATTKATEASTETTTNLLRNLFSSSSGKNIFSSFFDKIIGSPAGKAAGLSKEGETFNMDYADQGVAKQQGSVDKTKAGSAFGMVGSAISAALTGYMLGNMISGKFSVIGDKPETASALGTAIGLAVAGPIGAVIGGVVGGLANRAFGRGPKELQRAGIRGTFSASSGADVEQFAAFKQKGGWFRSDKNTEDVTKISEGLQNLFDQSIKATTRSVKKYAEALGLATNTVDSFSKEIFIDLKDLTEDQIAQAITNGIKNWSDELIKATYPELEKFRLMGDTISDTLSKLGGNLLTVNNVFSDLGKNLFETSISGGILASNLVDIFEGLDKFTQQLDFYYQNFYSEEERLLTKTNKVTDAMADLGLSSIDTKEEFRQLIDGLDLTKESNQILLKSLMDIAPAFNEVYTSISKSIESLKQDIKNYEEELINWKVKELEYYKKNIEAIKRTQQAELERINNQIDSYEKLISLRDEEISKLQEQINPLQKTVDGLKGFLDTIKKYKTSLLMGSESILTPGQKYTASKSELQSVIQNLTSSDETTRQKAESDLQSVSSQFLQASRDFYASSSQYTSDFNFVMNLLDNLETSATTQLSTDELALEELKNQVTALNMANDLDRDSIRYQENLQEQTQQIINDLDRQLEYYDRQIDELTTVNYTLTEIRDNIALYTERILSAQTSLAERQASIGTVDSSTTSNLVTGFNSGTSSGLSINDRFASTTTAASTTAASTTTASPDTSNLSAQQLANIRAGGVYVNNGASGDSYDQQWVPVDEMGNPKYNPFSSAIDTSSSGWATGTNYVPQDMQGTVHEGERIVPRADNAKLFQMIEGYQAGSNTNQEMVQEIRKLNQKIESLERTIAEGDIMNAQATDRNTLEVSRSITNSNTDQQYMESIRRRTQI